MPTAFPTGLSQRFDEVLPVHILEHNWAAPMACAKVALYASMNPVLAQGLLTVLSSLRLAARTFVAFVHEHQVRAAQRFQRHAPALAHP